MLEFVGSLKFPSTPTPFVLNRSYTLTKKVMAAGKTFYAIIIILTAKVFSAVSLNFLSTSLICNNDHVNMFISICVFSVVASANGGPNGNSHIVGLGVKPGYILPLHFIPPTAW